MDASAWAAAGRSILIAFVVCASVSLAPAATRAAEGSGVVMEAKTLLAGNARTGSWMAIDVRLTNSGPPIVGEIRLAGGAQGRTRFGAAVDLPTQSDKTYRLYAQPLTFGREIKIDLVSGESTVATTKASFTLQDANRLVIGIVAERAGDIIGSIDLPPGPNGVAPLTVAIDPADLPARVEAWGSLDRLVWQDTDSSRLSTEQLSALRGWVAGGGRLVIVGGTAGPASLSAFPDPMLPYRPTATTDVAPASLGALLGEVPENAADMPALSGELSGGRALVSVGDRVVAAERPYGGGAVTIVADSRADLARATGFVHAQERFFQMDLLRRRAGGELSALFGSAALGLDRGVRVHGFRRVAVEVAAAAAPRERAILDAYTAGVNDGLRALRSRPFEYVLLRAEPEAWKPEDSALVILAMFLDLQEGNGSLESALGLVHDLFPAALAAFLAPPGTEWDAPLEGEVFAQPAVPGPEVFDLRGDGTAIAADRGTSATSPPVVQAHASPSVAALAAMFGPKDPDQATGSNSFAVGASRTADGRAIVASDMHLGLDVPNIWYRMSWRWREGGGAADLHRTVGVTLPGTPALVAGSNTNVAWAFTNSFTDTSDLVVLEPGPSGDDTYLTPDGPKPFERRTETIAVKGAPSATLEVLSTIWGPVIDKDYQGRRRALRWVAHDPAAVNFRLLGMERADSTDDALDRAQASGVPAQNILVVDRAGRIGWTICGIVPARRTSGTLPVSWARGAASWEGWLLNAESPGRGEGAVYPIGPRDYPFVIDPPGGCLWTANARLVGGDRLATVGDGGYVLGARARHIRDDLLGRPRASEADLAEIQLDDRALFLERWRGLLLSVLDERAVAADPRRLEMRDAALAWGGRASVDSVGYRLVRGFRQSVADRVFEPFAAICRAADGRFNYRQLQQYEGPLWALVEARPVHLLDPKYKTWDELLLAGADGVLFEMRAIGPRLADRTWGERNTAAIRHPLSRAVPLLGRWLDMPAVPLPGDNHMPRVQAPSFGASERFVVSPGHEEDALFQMPGGQSGHPLSEHYADGEDDWASGRPARFLPGPARHTLILIPAR
jgi:penicillin amidase